MKGLVISSGTIKDYDRLNIAIKENDFIICADGGMNHIMEVGKSPDLVIGDLDSINQNSLNYIEENKIPIQKFPTIKDDTDTGIALEYLIEKGFKEITLMGVTGTRQDHTLAKIFLLDYIHGKNIKGKIIDDNNIIYLVDDYLRLEYMNNSFVSVIPITETGIEVSLSGFFYNLDNIKIKFGSTYGISNKVIEEYGEIKIHNGKALVFISRD